MPGRSSSFVHTSSSLARCASAERHAVGRVGRRSTPHEYAMCSSSSERVEVVRQVVVVGDDGPVAVRGCAADRGCAPPTPGGRGGSPNTPSRAAVPSAVDRSRALDAAPASPLAGERPHPAEAVGEVAVDVEVAGDVGPGQPELVGAPEQAAQRARRLRSTTTGRVQRARPRCRPRRGARRGGRRRPSRRTVAASIGGDGPTLIGRPP